MVVPFADNLNSLHGCENVKLVKAQDLNSSAIHVPNFVTRMQEWKRYDVMWF